MAENNKYDLILSELNSMDGQVLVLRNKWKDTEQRNRELDQQSRSLKQENFELQQKISMLEEEIQNFKKKVEEITLKQSASDGLFNSLNLKERENLKVKLQNLISKIDYHLTSDNAR